MSDIIKLLPDSVANQIAAGEVIQRPASVIKELVENAVDAGATDIRITVVDAGKTMIQVADNGSGMSDMDARMAFERHATSKIREAADLFRLHSMGFRGEALPSICAISEVELKTRIKENALGTRLVIEASKVKLQEPVVAEPGTVISVKRLFFNVPARRRFLKSDRVEESNIMREFERLALVNHNIRMSIDTGTRRMELRAGTLRQRIEELWKGQLKTEQLLPLEIDTPIVKISGYVARPEFARRQNPLQYMIVNGRNMRHPYFHKAVMNCYQSLIAQGTQPCYFLMFDVDPAQIDVNIHPTKNEIKFENEQQIWPILVSAVKTSLGRYSAVPSIDFNSDAIEFRPLKPGEAPVAPSMGFSGGYNPFDDAKSRLSREGNGGGVAPAYRPTRVETNWQSLYDGLERKERERKSPAVQHVPETSSESLFSTQENAGTALAPICMQFALKYIITTVAEGLMVIDQHRAHVKILYEDYISRRDHSEVVARTLMFPETVNLDMSQRSALGEVESDLAKFGFTLEYIQDNEWQITAVPAQLQQQDVREVLLRILDSVTEDSVNYGNEQRPQDTLQQKISLVMARSAAIRRGVKLSQKEMEEIIARLFSLADPALTPNGNPVFAIITQDQLAKLL